MKVLKVVFVFWFLFGMKFACSNSVTGYDIDLEPIGYVQNLNKEHISGYASSMPKVHISGNPTNL